LKSVPVLTKLAVILRNLTVVRFVLAKFATLRSKDKQNAEAPTSEFVGEVPSTVSEAPGAVEVPSTVDETPSASDSAAILESSDSFEIAEPAKSEEQPDDSQPVRERLIRRRWAETGIKMWDSDFHGAGHAALGIQGRSKLLPPEPDETLPRYDRLEFKLVDGRIVCEGVEVDPPQRRR